MVAVPALVCGVLLGYLVRPEAEPVEKPTQPEIPAQHVAKPAPAASDEALNRLRRRVHELERQLAEKSQPSAQEEEAVEVQAPTNRPSMRPDGPPMDFRARMEEMRTNNPERYAQMTNHMAQMRAQHIQQAQNRLDILASVNTSRMSPKQQETHRLYQELIAQQQEMRDMMRPENHEAMTDEQRREAFDQMRQIDHQLRRIANDERNILLSQTALTFGVKGQNAKDMVDTVKAVIEATETHGWPGGPRGGGPGGPRGPGGHGRR